MSERIVSDPSQHGWVDLGNGKWGWAAGGGGGIQSGDTEGQVTTWDGGAWTPDSSLTIDASGNAAFSGTVNTAAVGSTASGWTTELKNGNELSFSRGSINYIRANTASGSIRFETNGSQIAHFQNDGNATFSGTVDAASFTVNGEPIGGGGNDLVKADIRNVFIGDFTPNLEDSTTYGNVAIGRYALWKYADTNTGSNSGDNVAIGHTALSKFVTGYRNIAIGKAALTQAQDSVNDSIAMGKEALKNALGGSRNIAIGSESMMYVNQNAATKSAAFNNVAIGSEALRYCGSYSNVGIGYRACRSTYRQRWATCIGNETHIVDHADGTSLTLGATAIGHQASVTGDNTMTLGNSQLVAINTSATINSAFVNAEHGLKCRGSAVPSVRDLIDVLKTLRDATKDETTVEGMRSAIGHAANGLIQRMESIEFDAKQYETDYEGHKRQQLAWEAECAKSAEEATDE